MTTIAGSIDSISLDGRRFAIPQDADAARFLGGDTNEVLPNGDGNTARIVKTPMPWSIEGLQVAIDDELRDQEALQDFSNRRDFFPIVITMAAGSVFSGSGIVTGDTPFANQTATSTLSLKGQGRLVQQ